MIAKLTGAESTREFGDVTLTAVPLPHYATIRFLRENTDGETLDLYAYAADMLPLCVVDLTGLPDVGYTTARVGQTRRRVVDEPTLSRIPRGQLIPILQWIIELHRLAEDEEKN